MPECLNILVIHVVSLPIHVNVVHLRLSVGGFLFSILLKVRWFCGWIWKELL